MIRVCKGCTRLKYSGLLLLTVKSHGEVVGRSIDVFVLLYKCRAKSGESQRASFHLSENKASFPHFHHMVKASSGTGPRKTSIGREKRKGKSLSLWDCSQSSRQYRRLHTHASLRARGDGRLSVATDKIQINSSRALLTPSKAVPLDKTFLWLQTENGRGGETYDSSRGHSRKSP